MNVRNQIDSHVREGVLDVVLGYIDDTVEDRVWNSEWRSVTGNVQASTSDPVNELLLDVDA